MSAKIIDGNALAREIRSEWKSHADLLIERGMQPGLAVIIVGSNPASSIYVRNKARACDEVGIYSEVHSFLESASQDEVIARIRELNIDARIHGILVQLPLPNHFESSKVISVISVEKDVDGFHLCNVGALVTGNTVFPPCTPFGVIKMLEKN
ncbi:MAG: tetrahydrofolate dehydrogenase/cyclohydrolase catalytic domain-containing protein, partial [Nitrosomonadaceae bacterium]